MKKILGCVLAGARLAGISFSQSVAPPQSKEMAPASVAPKQPVIEMHFTPGTLIRAELQSWRSRLMPRKRKWETKCWLKPLTI
ncbi:MAG: hypothetical protein WB762_26290 [Candidatus Sulfotelmatobacter sp.]